MPTYIHELNDWPRFTWSHERINDQLAAVSRHQGLLIGRMEALGFPLRAEAVLQSLNEEVIKSSEVEGEVLDNEQVRSSIARRLGLDTGALAPVDRNVEMMLDATQGFDPPLTEERPCGWHASLFPTGHSRMNKIIVGGWRPDTSGPMQVVFGPMGREKVHYQAPAAARLKGEMRASLKWFSAGPSIDPVLKAAVSHLWFVSLHPFEVDNSRDFPVSQRQLMPARLASRPSRRCLSG